MQTTSRFILWLQAPSSSTSHAEQIIQRIWIPPSQNRCSYSNFIWAQNTCISILPAFDRFRKTFIILPTWGTTYWYNDLHFAWISLLTVVKSDLKWDISHYLDCKWREIPKKQPFILKRLNASSTSPVIWNWSQLNFRCWLLIEKNDSAFKDIMIVDSFWSYNRPKMSNSASKSVILCKKEREEGENEEGKARGTPIEQCWQIQGGSILDLKKGETKNNGLLNSDEQDSVVHKGNLGAFSQGRSLVKWFFFHF